MLNRSRAATIALMSLPTEFLPDPLPANPLALATTWLTEAWRRAEQPNPNAMVLATVDATGQPSARVVLCKEIVAEPGYLRFYTNYRSRKGRELEGNPRAAITMHWDHAHRQVRIEGRVALAPAGDSDAYFTSRPWQRQIGAWASAQSEPIDSRQALLAAVETTAARFGAPVPGPEDSVTPAGVQIPRPPHWGGYWLWASAVELWVEGAARIHDRVRYTRTLNADGETLRPGAWRAERLQP
jgi:pyridoxamine 5'-phosphate oxidase